MIVLGQQECPMTCCPTDISLSGRLRRRVTCQRLSLPGYRSRPAMKISDQPSGLASRGDTTRMIERMIGGAITPEKLMGRLAGGSSQVNSRAMTYNDSRRYDSRISGADRERMRADALEVLMEVLQ